MLAALAGMVPAYCRAQEISALEGSWVVTEIVGYADTSGGTPEAKRLLGMKLTIGKDRLSFDKQSCQPRGGFLFEEVDSAPSLEENYGINLRDSGVAARSKLLHSPNCIPVYLLGERRLLFGWNGVVVRATRG